MCEVLSSLPQPNERVQENLLEFISDLGKRNSLARWGELALRTNQLEAAVEEICRLSYLEEMRSDIPKFLSTATELGMEKTSPDGLHRRCGETLASARALEPVEALIASALAIARRTSERDYKAEAMVAGYLHTVAQFSAGDLIYRSAALTGEQAIDDLINPLMRYAMQSKLSQTSALRDKP